MLLDSLSWLQSEGRHVNPLGGGKDTVYDKIAVPAGPGAAARDAEAIGEVVHR
jgi:hypothetical protein